MNTDLSNVLALICWCNIDIELLSNKYRATCDKAQMDQVLQCKHRLDDYKKYREYKRMEVPTSDVNALLREISSARSTLDGILLLVRDLMVRRRMANLKR